MEQAGQIKERDWLGDRIKHIKGLKSPNDQQALLVALAEKDNRSDLEEKKLAALIRAERASVRAMKARQEAASLIYAEQREAASAARKQRTNRLILQGLLFDLAGLETRSRGELLGLLLSASTMTDQARWASWKERGDALLAEKSGALESLQKEIDKLNKK